MLKIQSFFEALQGDSFIEIKKVNIDILNSVDYVILEVNSGGTSWDNSVAYNIFGFEKIHNTLIPVWEPFLKNCFQKSNGYIVNDIDDEKAMHNRLSTEEVIYKIQATRENRLLLINS